MTRRTREVMTRITRELTTRKTRSILYLEKCFQSPDPWFPVSIIFSVSEPDQGRFNIIGVRHGPEPDP